MDTEVKENARSGFGTRLFGFATLAAFVSGIGYIGHAVYRGATDSFVAPIILSPDNDLVIANKLKISELYVERAKTVAQAEQLDAEVDAGEKAVTRLRALVTGAENALAYTTAVNARQVAAGAVETKILNEHRGVLTEMLERQKKMTLEARANAEAGLISKTDYAKELQNENQIALALVENQRTRAASSMAMSQAMLTQRALTGGQAMPLPEMTMRQDQVVRIELEILHLESEIRAKKSERKLVTEKLEKIAEIEGQLKARPVFRAVDKSMDVAFVPYTQIEGMQKGARVYDCVWGLVHCRDVGTVAEVVPGEVILPDPWGNQARGQYAVLSLSEHEAAKSKTLRVRTGTGIRIDRTHPSEPVSLR